MPKISADYIFDVHKGLLHNHYLEVNEDGIIQNLAPIGQGDEIDHYRGILTPGFINAHCHLELSAMKRQIPEATGMVGFIREIFSKRHTFTDKETILAAEKEVKKMLQGGTVAIGDICNTLISLSVKCKYPQLFTLSFIELLGLDPARVELELEKGRQYVEEFETEGMQVSITSHAPYSMSPTLLQEIAMRKPERLSIHLLESKAEREIFEEGTGDFTGFYQALNLPGYTFPSTNPIDYVLEGLEEDQPMILVHNTEMKKGEIKRISKRFPQASFCLCPRSNFFIHRTYPDIERFTNITDRICLGTDSLASNRDLQVFEEAKCIHKIAPRIPLVKVLDWLTFQGAVAIGQEARLGSFRIGSKPGVNLINELDLPHLLLKKESRVEKLF